MDDNRAKLIELLKKKHVVYKETFGTPSGKKVLEELSKDCYMSRSTITDSSTVDPYLIAFREGQRSVVLKIINCMSDKQIKEIEEREKVINES